MVRTQRVNSLFEAIPLLADDSSKSRLQFKKVPRTGFEPAHLAAPPPEDGASTNFATWAGLQSYAEIIADIMLRDKFHLGSKQTAASYSGTIESA